MTSAVAKTDRPQMSKRWERRITPELQERLCKAVSRHPTLKTAAHSCGVTDKAVMQWMHAGTMPGAREDVAEFACAFLQANAAHAGSLYTEGLDLIKSGDPNRIAAGRALLGEVHKRFRENDELTAMLTGVARKIEDLKKMFSPPTPRIRQVLELTGWVHQEAIAENLKREEPPGWLVEALVAGGWSRVEMVDTDGEES